MMRTALTLLVLTVGCSRRGESVRPATDDASTRPTNDAGAVDERRLRDLDPSACVATDALYVRTAKSVVYVDGAGSRTSFPLPAGFAAAREWSAGAGFLAWTEVSDPKSGGSEVRTSTLVTGKPGPHASGDDDSTDVLGLTIAEGRVVYRTTMPVCIHGADSCPFGQGLTVLPLNGDRPRFVGHEQYLWIPSFTIAPQGIVAAFNFITASPSIVIGGLGHPTDKWPMLPPPRKIASLSGSHEIHWPALIAADREAVYFTGPTGIERIDLTAPSSLPTTLVQATPGAVTGLVRTMSALVASLGNEVLVLEPSTGALLKKIVSPSAVTAAWAERDVVWCTRAGVFSVAR